MVGDFEVATWHGRPPGQTRRGATKDDAKRQTIGRYRITRLLGAGAMGEVYEAHDPALGRSVALKILLPHRRRPTHVRRMLREAQAMARIGHPNVVRVLDFGRHGSDVFIAMEYLPGRTLTQWLDGAPNLDRLLDVFIAAGRGLQAAHEHGLVHRDFKPDNVLVGDKGRVAVTDFGLAHAHRPAEPTPHTEEQAVQGEVSSESSAVDPSTEDAFDEPLTRTGRLLGTPAYMAPEQFMQLEPGPAADQYSFCVALFEALYGLRPHRGENASDLMMERLTTPPQLPRRNHRPRWLGRVVLRGLASDPNQRWPSMAHLLDALEHGRRSVRRGGWIAGAVVVAASLFVLRPDAKAHTACQDAVRRLEDTWNAETRGALRHAFAVDPRPFVDTTADQAEAALDRYARELASAWRSACSPRISDARHRCLESRQTEFMTLVDTLGRESVDTVAHAVTASAALPSLAVCNEASHRPAELDDPDRRRALRRLHHALARAWAAEQAGNFDEARTHARAIASSARARHAPPLELRASLIEGRASLTLGDVDAAKALGQEAYYAAVEHQLDDLAVEAALLLVDAFSAQQRRESAAHWLETARGRSGNAPSPELQARLLIAAAGLARDRGDLEQARLDLQAAVDLRERSSGRRHPTTAKALVRLGEILRAQARYGRALVLLHEALDTLQERLGESHPDTADAMEQLAIVLRRKNDFAHARPLLEDVLSRRMQAFGPDHPRVGVAHNELAILTQNEGDLHAAAVHYRKAAEIFEAHGGPGDTKRAAAIHNLGCVLYEQMRLEEAKQAFVEARTVFEEVLGPRHPNVALGLYKLSGIAFTEERYEDAEDLARQALEIQRDTLGLDHPDVGLTHFVLGQIARRRDRLEAARVHLRTSLTTLEKAYGERHAMLAHPLNELAALEIDERRWEEAVPLVERAQSLALMDRGSERPLAVARYLWGVAVWNRGDRALAREAVERALARFELEGDAMHDLTLDARSWLRTHRGG